MAALFFGAGQVVNTCLNCFLENIAALLLGGSMFAAGLSHSLDSQ